MKKIVLFALLFCISTYGKVVSDSVAIHLSALNDKQKNVLYEFEVLKNNGFSTDRFWSVHKNEFPRLSNYLRDELAKEVFLNSDIVYTPKKDSAVQLWMQTQLLTNWMFYLSAFIAICAVVALFKRYWSLLIQFLVRHIAPVLKILFSPVLLTLELLLIGVVCVICGCMVEEFVLRTVIMHLGLFLLWSQSTALFTKEYWIKRYVYEIENNFWGKDSWETIKTICFPAFIVTLALLYVLYKVPADVFYNYEIVLSAIAAVYALPFWRSLEKYIYPVLFPFYKEDYRDRSINSLAACTVVALVAAVAFILQGNLIFYNIISALISLLILSFLILSLKTNHKHSLRNYYFIQFVTFLFLSAVFMYGFNLRLNEVIGFAIIGSTLYVIIKYMEVFSFFSDWKRGKGWAWKLLGLALLLWLMGKVILYFSKMLFVA
ncbi:hypothetical protein [Flavobacterium sp. KACC 22763]|uniref:hypothetical protein n=1 Tax=Flavobacterium sp. KACC 22763 TaxID=3025668 RepID=UPI002366ECAA|nr:hypothetical protein [Flavobacterium sp. KACC 22763]WDF64024.1 hypothetical protein PQ463_20670 [Flavobacterium sp. KACC 22763]